MSRGFTVGSVVQPVSSAPAAVARPRFDARASAVATTLAAASAVCVVAAAWMHLRWIHGTAVVAPIWVGELVTPLAYPVVGAVLVHRRSRSILGWLLLTSSVLGLFTFAGRYAVVGLLIAPGSLPGATAAAWVNAWSWTPWLALMTLVPLYFPDDRLPSARWRWVARLATASAVTATVARMVAPVPIDAAPTLLTNPLGLEGAPWLNGLVWVALATGFGACAPAALASLVVRLRRTTGATRAQTQLLLAAVALQLVTFFAQPLLAAPLDDLAWTVGLVAIPAAIVVAITRHQLYDIELVLRRSLVYALLTAALLVASLAAVGVAGRFAPDGDLEVVVVAGVAIVAASARGRVQTAIGRRIFGADRDPFGVVDRIGDRLETAGDPVDALQRLLVEAADALRLPGVAFRPGRDVPVGSIVIGTLTGVEERFEVAADGSSLGALEVAARPSGRLTVTERRLLTELARRAASSVQAATMLAELRASRERLVRAREEERRRVRNDLHDGVGPSLAGLALQLQALERRLPDDPEVAAHVRRIRDELRDTVDEVRRVVDDLRPAGLDQGLVAAVRDRAAAFADLAGGPTIDVSVAGPLPPVGAATEVALHRIATEAMTNAVRHAGAGRIDIRFSATAASTTVEITDDGIGLADDRHPGVGLTSIRERAEELGGELQVLSDGGHGTTVRATIPRR